jgi:hypothetical protein
MGEGRTAGQGGLSANADACHYVSVLAAAIYSRSFITIRTATSISQWVLIEYPERATSIESLIEALLGKVVAAEIRAVYGCVAQTCSACICREVSATRSEGGHVSKGSIAAGSRG